MPLSYEVRSLYRFGVFELEAHTGELRRNGIKLKLQDQPYQVLLKLLEHAGQTVTREQLRSALWPADTFVDFETGLNTTIKRLRETLGDSAENPAFIETVPNADIEFHALASDHFFAGRRGTLPNFHSYPPATAAYRGALDSRRSSGSRHWAITGVATLNPCSFSGPDWTVLRDVPDAETENRAVNRGDLVDLPE